MQHPSGPAPSTANRREALHRLAAFAAASPVAFGQKAEPSPDAMVNVFDLEQVMKSRVNKTAYDYVTGGGWDEFTLRRNRSQFERILFRPRFFREVSNVDLSTSLLGLKLPMPIFVAPTGVHGQVHPQGEIATVKGAAALGALMGISTNSSFPLDKIAAAARAPLWFQLYTGPDLDGTREKVERAVDLGCKAIAVTVDAPYAAPRERDQRNQIDNTPERQAGARRRNLGEASGSQGLATRFQASLNWKFLRDLVAYAKVPVLVKGILTPEDAVLSIENGAAGVIVSNHGGRYLDGAVSTIEVLPEIVDAIGARGAVLIDGGFRRGTDILKALAIGARGVFVGRPPLWGLGAFGEAGVAKVLEILKKELAWAMALSGHASLSTIDRSLIRFDRP